MDKTQWISSVVTHPGRVRDHNEDAIYADDSRGLYVLADGMGGHAAGEVASRVALDTVVSEVTQGQGLRQAVESAHQAVLREAAAKHNQSGMGTTLVVVRSRDNGFEVAWVGDSRVYAWNGQNLRQVSRDHSYLEYLIETGELTREQARNHPKRHIVTQSIGLGTPRVDVVSVDSGEISLLLLCSDGLSDEIDDPVIAKILSQHDLSLSDKKQRLLESALQAGGKDNVSLILVERRLDGRASRGKPQWLASAVARAVIMGMAAALLTGLIVAWLKTGL